MPHACLVTVSKFIFIRFFSLGIILISFSAQAIDCSFGGVGNTLQFENGKTTYNYDSVNTYLNDCITKEFKNDYLKYGNEIPVKVELKSQTSLAQVVSSLKQGRYTENPDHVPNEDRNTLINVERFARKVKVQCAKDSNYNASLNAMSATNFPANVDQFISHCYQISQLAGMTLTLDGYSTKYDPFLISDTTLRNYYIQCEVSAPALACQALCVSNAPEKFRQVGCSQFGNKYSSNPSAKLVTDLAQECVKQMNTNPNHESCKQLCNAQSESCLDGLTASTDAETDSSSDSETADESQTADSGEVTNPTGDQADQLATAANDIAQRIFGGSSANGLNSNSNQSEVTSPTNSINSKLKASSTNGNGGVESTDLQADAAQVLPSSSLFPLNTATKPGGTKKDGPGGRAGGPPPGGRGGFNAGSGGGGGGNKDSRRGRRGGTKNTSAEDIDLNRFMGTNGSPGGNSQASTLSQKLKKQIDKNKKIDQLANKDKINAAFQNGLNRGVSNSSGSFLQGQFFPEAEAAYEYIRNNEMLPNEKGHL